MFGEFPSSWRKTGRRGYIRCPLPVCVDLSRLRARVSGVSTSYYVNGLSAVGNKLQGGLFFVYSTGSLPPTIGDTCTCHNKVLGNGVDLSA